jgi:hypothetical protein
VRFPEGMVEGEEGTRRQQPFTELPNGIQQKRALPGEGEPGASAGAQCGVVGEVEGRLRERARARGARGCLSGAGASVSGRSGRGALGVHWLGGVVA